MRNGHLPRAHERFALDSDDLLDGLGAGHRWRPRDDRDDAVSDASEHLLAPCVLGHHGLLLRLLAWHPLDADASRLFCHRVDVALIDQADGLGRRWRAKIASRVLDAHAAFISALDEAHDAASCCGDGTRATQPLDAGARVFARRLALVCDDNEGAGGALADLGEHVEVLPDGRVVLVDARGKRTQRVDDAHGDALAERDEPLERVGRREVQARVVRRLQPVAERSEVDAHRPRESLIPPVGDPLPLLAVEVQHAARRIELHFVAIPEAPVSSGHGQCERLHGERLTDAAVAANDDGPPRREAEGLAQPRYRPQRLRDVASGAQHERARLGLRRARWRLSRRGPVSVELYHLAAEHLVSEATGRKRVRLVGHRLGRWRRRWWRRRLFGPAL